MYRYFRIADRNRNIVSAGLIDSYQWSIQKYILSSYSNKTFPFVKGWSLQIADYLKSHGSRVETAGMKTSNVFLKILQAVSKPF